MSNVDVSDLEREELPPGKFPVDPRSAFRLQLSPDVHRGIQAHAKNDPSVEICGILVGRWGRDELGPFAQATDYIRCDNASSKLAEVTFTHESWAQINHEMDTKYADKRIVGWYHTHPDFGIFLSERDCFIHEHFFSGAGQVAYVVDPVRDLEGVFSWQKGKPTLMSHYWVGNEVRSLQASQRGPRREGGDSALPGSTEGRPAQILEAAATEDRGASASSLPLATTLLAWICLFLLGYGCADWRTRAEQRMLAEGAVAHYGYTKLMKLGMNEKVEKVRQELRQVESELAKLPDADAKLSADEAKKASDLKQSLGDRLRVAEVLLGQIQEEYGLSRDERTIYSQLELIARKQAELKALMSLPSGASSPPAQAKPSGASQPVAPKADTPKPASTDASKSPAEPASDSDANSQPTSPSSAGSSATESPTSASADKGEKSGD